MFRFLFELAVNLRSIGSLEFKEKSVKSDRSLLFISKTCIGNYFKAFKCSIEFKCMSTTLSFGVLHSLIISTFVKWFLDAFKIYRLLKFSFGRLEILLEFIDNIFKLSSFEVLRPSTLVRLFSNSMSAVTFSKLYCRWIYFNLFLYRVSLLIFGKLLFSNYSRFTS